MKRSVKIKSYCTTLGVGLAAVAWSVCHPTTGLQSVCITLAVAVAWWLDWDKWHLLRKGLMVFAGAACLVSGIELAGLTAPELSFWQWMLGWILFVGLLYYFGKKALYEGGILLGLAAAGSFLLIFLAGLTAFDGSVQWSGGSWGLPLWGSMVLLGCGLTGRELAEDKCAARWGGLSALSVWVLSALLPLLLWSGEALEVLAYPLRSAWQQAQLFSLLFCPDVVLCALAAVLCLWQNAAVLLSFKK